MNLLEKSLEQAFEVDREGRVLFFPFGMLSKGRLIEDPQTYESVRAKFIFICSAMLAGVVGIEIADRFVISFEQSLYGIAIVVSLSAICLQLLAMQLPFADERLNARRAMRKAAGSYSTFRLVMLSIAAWVLTTAALIAALVGDGEARWAGIAGTGFFGTCLAVFIWMIVAKSRPAELDAKPGRASRGDAAVSRNDRGRA